jgi:hypothetical protein
MPLIRPVLIWLWLEDGQDMIIRNATKAAGMIDPR